MKKISIIIFIAFFIAITAAPAHAYLDPGTGSMILQIVIGAVAGALLAVKAYWYKVSTYFSSRQKPGGALNERRRDNHQAIDDDPQPHKRHEST